MAGSAGSRRSVADHAGARIVYADPRLSVAPDRARSRTGRVGTGPETVARAVRTVCSRRRTVARGCRRGIALHLCARTSSDCVAHVIGGAHVAVVTGRVRVLERVIAGAVRTGSLTIVTLIRWLITIHAQTRIALAIACVWIATELAGCIRKCVIAEPTDCLARPVGIIAA